MQIIGTTQCCDTIAEAARLTTAGGCIYCNPPAGISSLTEAMPEKYGAGGKTATAQTGQLSENGEKLNTWFCGFFPAEKPKYVVIVLTEEGISGSKDSAPIFKKIADGINSLKK